MIKRFLFILVAIAFCVGCDQQAKIWAKTALSPGVFHPYLDGIFQLVLVENHGAFLSLGDGLVKHLLFVSVIGLCLFAGIFWLAKKQTLSLFAVTSGVLFISGGIGNLIDRTFNNGGVVDFMYMQYAGFHTGVFNIADIFIMIAATMMFALSFTVKKEVKH